MDKLRKWKQDHVEQLASDVEDDAMSGSDMDHRMSDLRKEVATYLHKACIAFSLQSASSGLHQIQDRAVT